MYLVDKKRVAVVVDAVHANFASEENGEVVYAVAGIDIRAALLERSQKPDIGHPLEVPPVDSSMVSKKHLVIEVFDLLALKVHRVPLPQQLQELGGVEENEKQVPNETVERNVQNKPTP